MTKQDKWQDNFILTPNHNKMSMNYPDYDTLREEYEAGNISAVDFILQQSDEVTEDYHQFCEDEGLDSSSVESAKAFMDFREELFEESISN